jgi:hypothetical protein
MGIAARSRVETSFPLEQMGERMSELLERAIELHGNAPGPVPSQQMARLTATEAVELTRAANEADRRWGHVSLDGGRSVGTAFYFLLRDLGGPLYRWTLGREWTWVPRLKSAVQRLLVGRQA